MAVSSVFTVIGALVVPSTALVLGHMYYKTKTHALDMICDHPELSDDKVKYLVDMMKLESHQDPH